MERHHELPARPSVGHYRTALVEDLRAGNEDSVQRVRAFVHGSKTAPRRSCSSAHWIDATRGSSWRGK